MNNTFFAESDSILTGNYSQPFGLGFECELVQRAAQAQIIKFLPEITEQLQEVWDHRDEEFCDALNLAYKKLIIPPVNTKNIIAGVECFSVLESPIEMWPNILIYARDATPYGFQEDQFDTVSVPLRIEVLCAEGPIKSEEIHDRAGIEMMELLDRQLQRLADGVYLCLQKDKTLSGTIGQIEKPAKVTTSLPQSRKKELAATGESYIFQGKQYDFTVQKISF